MCLKLSFSLGGWGSGGASESAPNIYKVLGAFSTIHTYNPFLNSEVTGQAMACYRKAEDENRDSGRLQWVRGVQGQPSGQTCSCLPSSERWTSDLNTSPHCLPKCQCLPHRGTPRGETPLCCLPLGFRGEKKTTVIY